jgi:predicted hotdog family 3-hydroxylacyl-ACP dehydratase
MDVERLSAAYAIRVRAVLNGEFPGELRLSDRLDPRRWALEWNLPAWLGRHYGLEPLLSEELCLSNVLGLASIRLRDDLQDGELSAATDQRSAIHMSDRLYEEALGIYRRSFDPASEFWPQLGLRMEEWRAATMDGGSAKHLAMRGAPLKISAFAVCLLAGRVDQFPAVGRCLDHALTAMVLYDHVVDWREDLAAGRWNAFVASATVPGGGPLSGAAGVELSMMTTDAVSAYFELIGKELNRAAALASGLGVGELETHLRRTAADLEGQGRALAARYMEISERAHQLLFGNQPPLAA